MCTKGFDYMFDQLKLRIQSWKCMIMNEEENKLMLQSVDQYPKRKVGLSCTQESDTHSMKGQSFKAGASPGSS